MDTRPETPSRQSQLWRWLCILPVALLAGFVASLVSALFTLQQLTGRVVNLFISQTTIGLAIVLAGAWTAPRRRVVIAAMLAVLWSVLSGFMHIALHPNPHGQEYLTVGLATLASVVAVYIIRTRQITIDDDPPDSR